MNRIAGWFTDGIKLSITLVIAAAILTVYGIFQVGYGNMKDNQREQAILEEVAEYAPFDNRVTVGSQIITAMRKYSMNDYVTVYVKNASVSFAATPTGITKPVGTVDYSTGILTGGSTTASVKVSQMKDETSAYYILPQQKYQSQLVTDNNRVVVGILFIIK